MTGLRINLWMTSGWIHNRGGTAIESLLIKSIADSHKPFPDRQSSQFLLQQIADRHSSSSRSRSQTDTGRFSLAFLGLALLTKADPRLTMQPVPFAFWGGPYGPPPGTRDWSIARDCSIPPPMGRRHVLTDRQSAGWGLAKRGAGRRRSCLSVHHHRMNTGQPATPPDTHVTSNYRTTWLNMHLRGDLG